MPLNPFQRANYRKHTHTSDQVIDPDTEEPIDPSGAAGVTVTDGVTTVEATCVSFPAGTVCDEGAGAAAVATGVQTVSLIGPFAVAWDDAGIEDTPGVKVADLPAGAIVLKTIVVGTEAWGGVLSSAELVFTIADTDGSPRLEIEGYDLEVHTTSGGGVTLHGSSAQSLTNGTERSVFRDDGGVTALYARLVYDSGTPDSGSADVYALIVSPA
jgi:hypothetical protein